MATTAAAITSKVGATNGRRWFGFTGTVAQVIGRQAEVRGNGGRFSVRPEGSGKRRVRRRFGESSGFFAAWSMVQPFCCQRLLHGDINVAMTNVSDLRTQGK